MTINTLISQSVKDLEIDINSIDHFQHNVKNKNVTELESAVLRNILQKYDDIIKEYTTEDCWPSVTNPIMEPDWNMISVQLVTSAMRMQNQKKANELLKLAFASSLVERHINLN